MNNLERNSEIARSLEFFDKTIAILRLGADEKSVLRLEGLLRDIGFYVYEITPEKFASDGGEKNRKHYRDMRRSIRAEIA